MKSRMLEAAATKTLMLLKKDGFNEKIKAI
jgi:hypothetical protein